MSSPLRSLLLGFGIEVTGKEKLDKVDSKLDGMISKVMTFTEGLATMFAVKTVTGFITDQIEVGRSLGITAEKLGLTVDELERFRYAAGQSGVEAGNADRALGMFNRQLGEAELNGKTAAKGVNKVGEGFTSAQLASMPLMEMLGHVADKFEGMTDKGLKTQLAMKLFGRQGAILIPMLDQGAAGLAKWNAQFDALGGGIGEEFTKEAKEAGDGIKRLGFVFDVLKTKIVSGLLPWVEKFVELMSRAVVWLSYVAKHSYMAQTALVSLGIAAAIALAPFLAGILPIVAALGALYLVLDDVYTLFKGGDSYSGDFLNALFGEGSKEEFVRRAKETFHDVLTVIKKAWTWLKGVDWAGSFDGLLAAVRPIADLIKVMFETLEKVLHMLSGNKDVPKPVSAAEQAARQTAEYYNGKKAPEYGAQNASFYMDNKPPSRLPSIPGIPEYTGGMPRQLSTNPGGDFIGPPAPPTVIQHNDTHIIVQGATTNAGTGGAVRDAVLDGFQQQLKDAANALPVTPSTRQQVQ